MAETVHLYLTSNGAGVGPTSGARATAGLESDGELVQAACSDCFEFEKGQSGAAAEPSGKSGGFSDVSGLGTEVTVAAHTPEWHFQREGDPGAAQSDLDNGRLVCEVGVAAVSEEGAEAFLF